MPHISSNLPEVVRSLHALGQVSNLRRRVGKGRFGDAILARVAEQIVYRSHANQTDPSGRTWARLNHHYLLWKIRHGFDPRRNIMTGSMLSYEEVLGKTTVTDSVAAMNYGTDEENRLKAEWAAEGSGRRPPRPFYDLGRDGEAAVDEVVDAVADEYLSNL